MNSTFPSADRSQPCVRATEGAAQAEHKQTMRDKIDTLRMMTVVVATQLLFRTTLLLRRWNY